MNLVAPSERGPSPPAGEAGVELAVSPVVGRDRLRCRIICMLVDVAAISVGSWLAFLGTPLQISKSLWWVPAFGLLILAGLGHRGFYRFSVGKSLLDQVAQLVGVTAAAAATTIVLRVLVLPASDVGPGTLRVWAFVTVHLAVGRVALALELRRLRRAGSVVPALIVGAGQVGALVGTRLQEHPEFGLLPLGYLDDDPRPVDLRLPLLGTTKDLEDAAAREGAEHVVVCFSAVTHDVLLDVVRRARRIGLGVSLVPRLYEEVTNRVAVGHLGAIPLLQVTQADPRGWQFAIKYFLDRAVATVALLCAAPVMVLVAAAVKLTSPGPVFYRQLRVGLDGVQFHILKFRTMHDGGEGGREPGEEVAAAMLRQESPLVSGDRRTGLGRWLRRLSIDEIPQLINVARGEMSFIGPRPERPSLAANFENHVYRYGERHRVKSGITGWAQVHGLRGRSSLADRVEWDNYYIENWSFWLDFKILLLTVPALLRGENAE